MKIKDIKKLKGLGIRTEEIEVDATSIIEHAHFENHNCRDYRKESIEYMIKNKINFHSTCNNDHVMFQKLIKVECPVCHRNMIVKNGSGNCSTSTTTYVCDKCKVNVNITIPSDSGIHVNFEKD